MDGDPSAPGKELMGSLEESSVCVVSRRECTFTSFDVIMSKDVGERVVCAGCE